MNLSQFFTQEGQLWPTFANSGNNVIETSTIYSDSGLGPTTYHDAISSANLPAWLTRNPSATPDGQDDSILFRAVWVHHDPVQKVNHISSADLSNIVQDFGLDGVQELCATAISGAERVRLPSKFRKRSLQRYCFRSHPKIMVLWSYDSEISQTSAICFAGKEQLQKFKKLVSFRWQASVMLLPFACATILSAEIDQTQEITKHEIRAIEARTGYHRWTSRNETPATGDLSSLSATMSGLAAKMAAAARKWQVVEHLIDFVAQEEAISHRHHMQHAGAESEPPWTYGDEATYLKERARMQRVDTDFIQRRIDIQMSALLGLIAQYDALASHKTAHESKIIAMASQRDSSSMKTLAAVTILYLPGQVVASIFEMPLFNWTAGQSDTEAESNVVNNRFYLYWAVTIPLTVFTFLVAGSWLLFEKRHRWKKTIRMDVAENDSNHVPEVKVLTRSRSTIAAPLSDFIHLESPKLG